MFCKDILKCNLHNLRTEIISIILYKLKGQTKQMLYFFLPVPHLCEHGQEVCFHRGKQLRHGLRALKHGGHGLDHLAGRHGSIVVVAARLNK